MHGTNFQCCEVRQWTTVGIVDAVHGSDLVNMLKASLLLPGLGPRPNPTPARIASSIMRGVLEAIRAGVSLGLGPRLVGTNVPTFCYTGNIILA